VRTTTPRDIAPSTRRKRARVHAYGSARPSSGNCDAFDLTRAGTTRSRLILVHRVYNALFQFLELFYNIVDK
jgi:hypothetical protein